MKIEFLNASGDVIGISILDTSVGIESHYPYYEGAVSWREVDPAIVAAKELAERNEQNLINLVTKKIFKALFNHENRIRALEGKSPITADTFKTALINL